uniref:Uncharacterized protein n=1 Tax=mine drainage metagenome TaxID=410659 RepID=E6QPD1_9ZZZZ
MRRARDRDREGRRRASVRLGPGATAARRTRRDRRGARLGQRGSRTPAATAAPGDRQDDRHRGYSENRSALHLLLLQLAEPDVRVTLTLLHVSELPAVSVNVTVVLPAVPPAVTVAVVPLTLTVAVAVAPLLDEIVPE